MVFYPKRHEKAVRELLGKGKRGNAKPVKKKKLVFYVHAIGNNTVPSEAENRIRQYLHTLNINFVWLVRFALYSYRAFLFQKNNSGNVWKLIKVV